MAIPDLINRLMIPLVTAGLLSFCRPAISTEQPAKKRDPEMRRLFQQDHPCPSTGKTKGACPGYVVDHKTSIKRGGGDHPYNMQWQSIEDAKLKDRWE